jgi:hypothetical protein
MTESLTNSPATFADIIPDPNTIRVRLNRLEAEANLLRCLLRLAVRREREAERLAGKAVLDG